VGDTGGKILVIRGGAIGDFILTVPVLSALRQTFCSARIELLGYSRIAELARKFEIVDDFRSVDARPLASFFARNGKLDPELSSYFESFALIISYLYDPDEIFRANISRASKAQFIAGSHRPAESESIHATSVFLKPLEKLAIFDSDPIPRLPVSRKDISTRQRVAVHPGSGSEKKNWPVDNWIVFLRGLILAGQEVILIGGEADTDRIETIAKAVPEAQTEWNKPLSELAETLATCESFVGHDSGITHIAAAIGVKCMVLWGPTNENIWKPLNPNVKLVTAPDGEMHKLSIDVVRAEYFNNS
jgi:heptosyltransferase-2